MSLETMQARSCFILLKSNTYIMVRLNLIGKFLAMCICFLMCIYYLPDQLFYTHSGYRITIIHGFLLMFNICTL